MDMGPSVADVETDDRALLEGGVRGRQPVKCHHQTVGARGDFAASWSRYLSTGMASRSAAALASSPRRSRHQLTVHIPRRMPKLS